MKLSEYLLDRIFSLICMLVAALVLLALLWLIETPAVFILFAEVILLAAYSTALLYDFFRKQSFYNLLQKMTEQMDIKTLLGELMVPPHFLEGQILVDVLRCCNKYQNDQLACAEQENREYREYLDSWVHEIKTPITSARLIVENEKNPTTLRIDDELRKIDAYVEQVLYYARSTDVEKDFKVERTTLQAFLHQGNPNIVSSEIKDIRCKVDEFNLVIGSTFSGDTSSVHYGANQQVIYRRLDINIVNLCTKLTRTAEGYYRANQEKFNFFNCTIDDRRKF